MVYVIDDELIARESISALVESAGYLCEQFASAEDFLKSYLESHIACVVVDVRMPGMSGLDLQDRLLRDGIAMPVIMISAFAGTRATVRAMKQGAITFLKKPCNDEELYDAIRAGLDLAQKRHAAKLHHQDIERRLSILSHEEHDVLDLIVQGMPNKTIATRLDISEHTVKFHVNSVLGKLGAHSRTEAVTRATRLGLIAL